MFEQFVAWEKDRHAYAREWKQRTGGKVLGYFCTYLPEEIPYAAGVLPVRILGSHEPQDVTEPHIFGMFCPFCRDCLAQGLKGRYDYLDGIAIAQSCLHVRQAFTSWQKHVPVEYSYYLPFPHGVQSSHAASYLAGEIAAFRRSIEAWTGRPIGDDRLADAIGVYDENRRLLRQVYELRKASPPPLSGEEAMEMVLADQMVDKAEHSAALKQLLPPLAARQSTRGDDVRLMLIGSEDDDLPFIRMVESLGAVVVTDEHCTGTRYFWNEVGDGGDLEAALAARYVARPPCPSKDWPRRTRIPHVLALAREWDVKGAILIQQKFCDPHELDIPALRQALEAEGIRTLFLEFDVTVPLGQFRIRVEAFLEMLREGDIFADDLFAG
jgi:benzoyl-CoA reductase subunit C